MTRITIDVSAITDWDSFHDVFAAAIGFPDFYGRNMDAWIDCMTSLDAPDDGMSSVHAEPGGVLVLDLGELGDFPQRCPDIHEAIVDCTAFVNHRKLEVGEPAVLALSFSRTSQ